MNLFQKIYWNHLFERWMNDLQINCYIRSIRFDRQGLWVACFHTGSAPWFQIIEKGLYHTEGSYDRFERMDSLLVDEELKERDVIEEGL